MNINSASGLPTPKTVWVRVRGEMRAFHANRDAGLDGREERSLIGHSRRGLRAVRSIGIAASKLDQGSARGSREFFAALPHLFECGEHQIESGRKFGGHVSTI